MTAHVSLMPSLYALLPPESQPRLVAHLSLISLHSEPYFIRDDIYTTSQPILPGQYRAIRLRATPSRTSRGTIKGKERAENESWDYSLTYLSKALNGREYQETGVQACLGYEAVGSNSREQVEEFIELLGFR
jgi:hypothetical protein